MAMLSVTVKDRTSGAALQSMVVCLDSTSGSCADTSAAGQVNFSSLMAGNHTLFINGREYVTVAVAPTGAAVTCWIGTTGEY